MNKVKLINNADDFGLSMAINHSIIDAYKYGPVTSTSLLANMPGFEHAVALAKQHPGLGVGVHLNLTLGAPLQGSAGSLTDETGQFKNIRYYLSDNETIDTNAIFSELEAQIKKVIMSGITPTHLDSHHHVHLHQAIYPVYSALSHQFGLPVRHVNPDLLACKPADFSHISVNTFAKRNISPDIKSNSISVWPAMRLGKVAVSDDLDKIFIREVYELLYQLDDVDCIEVIWHPGYVDALVLETSSYNLERAYELKALLNDELRDFMQNRFELCRFDDL